MGRSKTQGSINAIRDNYNKSTTKEVLTLDERVEPLTLTNSRLYAGMFAN